MSSKRQRPRRLKLEHSMALLLLPTGCWGTAIGMKAEPEVSSSATSNSDTSDTGPSVSGTTGFVDDTRGPETTTGSPPPRRDVGSAFECDIFAQDCPPGEKCTVWADDGGSTWNAMKCVPVVDDPAGLDEPCHAERSGTSGIDDCDVGAMCWDVDPETLEGFCMPFCGGDESSLYCEDPNRDCAIDSGIVALCVPVCNPIDPNCDEGEACYPVQNMWVCAPDASGEDGAYGDACEFINVCDPGLICLDASSVPPGQACEGAAGCCTEICDLSDPAGDAQCAGAAGGQTCQAWYTEGTAPAGYENVGACALPA